MEAVKAYMRFDELVDGLEAQEVPQQENIIEGLRSAAVEYLRGAGIPEPEGESELYDLVVKALTLHWFDHRDDVNGEAPVPLGVRPVLNQLKVLSAAKGGGAVT